MLAVPQISVVTPVWNGLPYIKESVESVLAQDFQEWELVIGDNGSDDGTCDYLDTLKDPRIRVFKHEKNLQIYGNLNFLIRHVRAPIVQMLCADDYFLEGGLRRVIEEWKLAGRDAALIRFNWSQTRRTGKGNSFCFDVTPKRITPDIADAYYFLFGNLPGNLSNVSFRPAAVVEAGGFRQDLPYTGDFEMWSRLSCLAPQILSEKDVSYVRRHPGAASDYLNRKGELVAQTYTVMQGMYDRLRARFPAWPLKLYLAINYDGFHRKAGLKALFLKGSGHYLHEVTRCVREYPCLPPQAACWLVFLASLGGRFGRITAAKMLLRRMVQNSGNP